METKGGFPHRLGNVRFFKSDHCFIFLYLVVNAVDESSHYNKSPLVYLVAFWLTHACEQDVLVVFCTVVKILSLLLNSCGCPIL